MGDKRTDPGHYYPGGRVRAKSGTAPQELIVQWSDVQGKPQIAPLPDRYRESDMKGKINEIASKFALAAAAALIGWAGCADVSVTTKRLDELWNDDQVVVDVTGGGVDTNAVRDISREEISPATNRLYKALLDAKDGAARTLPKYLWLYEADDSYPDAAAEYYRSRGDGKTDGGCSAVRSGGFLYRNFDYPLDERAEFVVKMSAGAGRYASVGVAQVGTNLTEQMVTSGKWSKWYKALPGATVDGINERGVCAEINVVDAPVTGWSTTGNLHPLAAVRWILDHATNAQHGAEYIASHIAFPDGWTQNFHYMVADESATYVVENGACSNVTGRAVLTNFKFLPSPTYGDGWERYQLLSDPSESITNAWFTRCYEWSTNPPWLTEFGGNYEYWIAALNAWELKPKEQHRGESFGDKTWWQTVHTSVYDISNRVLRVAVQERPDWYVFQVPGASSVAEESDPVAMPRVAALEAEVAGIPRITESNDHEGWAKYADYASESDYATEARRASEVGGYTGGDFDDMDERIGDNGAAIESHTGDTNNPHGVTAEQTGAVRNGLVGGFAVTDEVNIATDSGSGIWLRSRALNISGTYGSLPPIVRIETGFENNDPGTIRFYHGGWFPTYVDIRPSPEGSVGLNNMLYLPTDKSGTFALTSDIPAPYVPSATDERFAAAVLAVGLNIDTNSVAVLNEIAATFGDFPITGTATTIGSLLAALAAAVAWLRKRAAHIDNSGFADNEFATDLMSKPGAISAVNNLIYAKIAPANADLEDALNGTEVA